MAAGELPRVGEVLRDKYELVRTLGEGGMAVVFEARHKDSGQRVAVKVLAPELARDPEIVARFDREARAVERLRTRHVAHVIEVAATDHGLPFMAMDFLDGRDLATELELRRALPIAEAVDYVLQTAAAMEEAHRAGVVHRDLKPANLFLTTEGTLRTVKVLDFGISKLIGEASKLTGAGAVIGTVIYMSPEQLRSASDVDRRADVWSLGVILFELLAGRAPFEGPGHKVATAIVSEDAPDVRTFVDVPEPLAAAIGRMLARDRDRRLSDMREVAQHLAPFVEPESHGARAAAYLGGRPPSGSRSGPAGKTLPLHKLQQRTMPLGLARPPAPSWAPEPAPARPARSAPLAKTVLTKGKRSQMNLAIFGGAALGLLAAVGIVLIALTLLDRRRDRERGVATAATTPASALPSSSATAAGSATAPPAPAPSTSAPAATTRAASSASGAPRHRASDDAGAAPPPTVNPTLL